MAKFTLYVKRKGGSTESANKAVTLLKTYVSTVVAKTTTFDDSDVLLVESDITPTLAETDAIVYMVKSVNSSVIAAQGGSVAAAEADGNTLGLTDLNKKICEVYFDRMYEGSPKELSGAIYHEVAHIKSNMDNSMHKDQNGFLKASPDYNGNPTDSNVEFMAKHLGKKVSMKGSY